MLLNFLLYALYSSSLFLNSSFADKWIKSRIEEEFSQLSEHSISKQDLLDIMALSKDGHLQLLLINATKNEISFIVDNEKLWQDTRTNITKTFLTKLFEKKLLPCTSFIIGMGDASPIQTKVPIFVFAKDKNDKNNILFPDFEVLQDNDGLINSCANYAKQFPWENKKNKIFWRGRTTNGLYTPENFRTIPRVKLIYLSTKNPHLIDAAFVPPLVQNAEQVIEFLAKEARPLMPTVAIPDHFLYKYLIDIDGNSCTYSRCRWIMLSNSVLLKLQSNNIQWYYHMLKPYENYVPINCDFSNIMDVLDWLTQNDNEAREISKRANMLAKLLFTKKNIQYYTVKLLQEYQKLIKQ